MSIKSESVLKLSELWLSTKYVILMQRAIAIVDARSFLRRCLGYVSHISPRQLINIASVVKSHSCCIQSMT